MKSVVVTGSSTGIGWGASKVLIQNGFRVFGSVRKPQDGERLKTEFGANFVPLLFDVTDAAAVNRAADQVAQALGNETLFGLVNNAGIAVAGPLLYLKIDELRHQLDVNLVAQVSVTQAFAPLLGADRSRKGKPGRIVMISSVGGRNANPFLGPYCASKFGLEGLAESLRRELMLFGIDVIVIAPGAVATAIWDKADKIDATPYDNTPYREPLDRIRKYMIANGPKGLKPERLGAAIHRALTAAHPKVRYTLTPDPIQNFVMNTFPKRMVDRMIGGRLGLVPGKN
ncbi:MAG: SDR family oxidoreductase [Alphaproteobacteria bacterium]|nr:SDR family oxidoreductase [Alphaproteobacteria bacterium]MBV9694340.1 SDR family oxidoreductase [Alphaproteobacteria bacterium]